MNRCHCKPMCLATILPDDDVVMTPAGPALLEHVLPSYPQEMLPLDLTGRVS